MENKSNLSEILNDLIKINNDRVRGYEKAIEELDPTDLDLKALYQQYAQQSKGYATQLGGELQRMGEKVTTDTTLAGKIYRGWMEVKSAFSSDERKSTLESCEFGEDAAQKAYKEALSASNGLPVQIANMLTRQQADLRSAHDTIKRQRDMHAVK